MRSKQWCNDTLKLAASMAMRTEFAAWIMNSLIFFLFGTRLFSRSEDLVSIIYWRGISRKILFEPHCFLSKSSLINLAGNWNAFTNGIRHVKKMNINHHSPRLMLNSCQILDPPYFLLPTTFKLYPCAKNKYVWSVLYCRHLWRTSNDSLWQQARAELEHFLLFGYLFTARTVRAWPGAFSPDII